MATSYEDVLSEHFKAMPHVAEKIVKPTTNVPTSAAAPANLPTGGRLDLATAEEILAAHFKSMPHVAARLQAPSKQSSTLVTTSPAPLAESDRMDLQTAEEILREHFAQRATGRVSRGLAAAPEIVTGSGDFQYAYVPEAFALPAGVEMQNGHGLCLDATGNICESSARPGI